MSLKLGKLIEFRCGNVEWMRELEQGLDFYWEVLQQEQNDLQEMLKKLF